MFYFILTPLTSHATALLQEAVPHGLHVLVGVTAPRRGYTALRGERGVASLALLERQGV